MRRIVPVLSAVALAGVISVPMMMSTSSVSASAPAEGPYCMPHVLPAPLNILEFYRDSYIQHLGQGQCEVARYG